MHWQPQLPIRKLNRKTTADLAVKTRSIASWTLEAGSILVQHVPSLKFMWLLQYMLSRIWEFHDKTTELTWMPSSIEERKPDANRRDDEHMWTELSALWTQNMTPDNIDHFHTPLVRYCRRITGHLREDLRSQSLNYLTNWMLGAGQTQNQLTVCLPDCLSVCACLSVWNTFRPR